VLQVFARKVIRPFAQVTEQDIENEANAISALCTDRRCMQIIYVLKHGWLTKDHSYYFIDMEYCPETLEDRIKALGSNTLGFPREGEDGKATTISTERIITPNRVAISDARSIPEVGDWDILIDTVDDISAGLDYIHKEKFVHRDLKPRNGINSTYLPILMQFQFSFLSETNVGN
jgi:serine/threonine protein kinase